MKNQTLLATLKWEQERLYPLIQHYEEKEMNFFKLTITIMSLYLTAIGTIFTLSNGNNQSVLLTTPFDKIFIGVTVALCFLNLSLIKFISSNRAGCILTMRQINCFRQAIDKLCCKLYNDKVPDCYNNFICGEFWGLYGQHRKLPLNNNHFRNDNEGYLKYLFYSSDGFLIFIIVLFSMIMFCSPILYILFSSATSEKWFVFSLGALALLFVFLVVFVVKVAKDRVKHAFNIKQNAEKGDTCDNFYTKCNKEPLKEQK